MSFEKFDGNLEKSSVENIETNASQLEKNIEVEKPDSVLAKESAEKFIQRLENGYLSSYEERMIQTPRPESGTWNGERGESKFMPNDEEAQKEI